MHWINIVQHELLLTEVPTEAEACQMKNILIKINGGGHIKL